MITSFNYPGYNRNNMMASRILTASANYRPAEMLQQQNYGMQSKPLTANSANRINLGQQQFADRIVDVLERSLSLLIDRLVTKVDQALIKLTGTNSTLTNAGQAMASQEMPVMNIADPLAMEGFPMQAVQQAPMFQAPQCQCPPQGIANNIYVNSAMPQQVDSGFSLDSLGGGMLGAVLPDSLGGVFDGVKNFFGGIFESVKKFLKNPTGIFKGIFGEVAEGGFLSGAAKLLGGLF